MTDQLDRFTTAKTLKIPTIYAYSENNPNYEGCLKIGYTEIDVEKRVKAQFPTLKPGKKKPYQIVFSEPAFYFDAGSFMDHDVFRVLQKWGIKRVGGEWFRCGVKEVRAAWLAVKNRTENFEQRSEDFLMRPEQEDAVERTLRYFDSIKKESKTHKGNKRTPKFLWNAKMRFGKTFTAYQLARRMKVKKVLILTFKPAVQSAWRDDLMTHVDFEGWQFISKPEKPGEPKIDEQYKKADKKRPIVCFGSFQDFLGYDTVTKGIKPKNEWVHTTNWDLVIFDEYHFGAWRERAKNLFENEDDDLEPVDLDKYDRGNAVDESFLPITAKHYLFLSGTPFRALNSGEFIEEQIYNWTYSDEQKAKENWAGKGANPYEELPRMVLMTYKIPDSISEVAKQGEFDEFDLNVFFSAKGKGNSAAFVYEEYVQKWLDLIRGNYQQTTTDDLKLGKGKPAMPFSDTRLRDALSHTLWLLPDVASCEAMKNLLAKPRNMFYRDFTVNLCAGAKAGIGLAALPPVLHSMEDPLEGRTITLSCGKLTTGVTVRPWTGVFMLRNLKSPETYFQAAFRGQSPWTIKNEDGSREIIKRECFVFDFALDRALKQVADYACQLDPHEPNPEKKVSSFICFLPVLAYDGSTMKKIDAGEILDMALSGTSATLLARRWESALLVNVDNDTLRRLMENEKALEALMKIEGFRNLNKDIETIINRTEAIKKAQKDTDNPPTKKEVEELSKEEKELKSKRKEIQEKLIKFATRIPIFMYLSDYREQTLEDVITQLEPEIFKKATGLDVKDFDLLRSLNVFNGPLMNDAVWKFKRYEDASLEYTGLNSKHDSEKDVGLFNTVITRDEYLKLAEEQQKSAGLA